MPDPKRAIQFLTMAAKDLDAIRRMRDDPLFSEEVFGLHAQQAVEKALKAWLYLAGSRVPRIHDIEELMALVVEQGETVPESLGALIELTDFAVQFRYEPYPEFDDPLDRQAIVEQVEMLIEHVRGRP